MGGGELSVTGGENRIPTPTSPAHLWALASGVLRQCGSVDIAAHLPSTRRPPW